MGKAWIKARKRDTYHRRAKEEGYRSRATYKLQQIDDKFHLFRRGATVLDLGAAPGGWSQLARELVGDEGRVVAVDLVGMAPIDGVEFFRGDLRDEETLRRIGESLPEGVDVVLSDMAPKLSGNKSLDQARSTELAEMALEIAKRLLKPEGSLAVKVFQGELYPSLRRKLARAFQSCRGFTPPASTSQSAETYLVCQRLRGAGQA